MRKILKFLFSQVAIVSFLMILQILAITGSLLRISQYFLYFDVLLQFISIATVIIIVNRHSNPSYKLAWVIPILLVPLFGGLFYLFITGQHHTKRYFNKLSANEKKINEGYSQKEDILKEITEKFPERRSTVGYINRVCGTGALRCHDSRYFPLGEDMHKSMLSELEKATRYIFIEFYIIKEGIMWDSILEILKKKAASGVDVRIMYDGMGSMTLLPYKYPEMLEKYGIKCKIFSPFTPFLSSVQNNRDHRKIMVIDGKVAYTGGVNLSDEYINEDHPYGHWKDMSVMVKGEAAFSYARMFLHLWWGKNSTEENIKSFEPVFSDGEVSESSTDGYVMPFCDMPQDKFQTGEFIYTDIINKAKKYVYITTPYLVPDHEMVNALKNASLGGIDVKIICPEIADHWYTKAVAYSYYKELLDAGISIYEYSPGFIHGKTFCSDDEIAVVGSINLDYRSLYLQFECAAWFLGSSVVHSAREDFDKTLEKCNVITQDMCTPDNVFRRILNALLRLFAPLM